MNLNTATQAYSDEQRARILKEAARFNANVDKTVADLEEKVEKIYDLQSELYTLTDQPNLDEKAINEVLRKLFTLGVIPAVDPNTQRPY